MWGKYWKLYTVLCYRGVVYLLYMLYFNMSYVLRVLLLVVLCLLLLVVLCVLLLVVLCVLLLVVLCELLSSYVYLLYYVCILVFTLDAGLEGPATGHLDTSFSRFPCVYKQMLRWFPRFQVATTCFSCSSPDLNSLVSNFIFCIHVK